MRASPLLHVEWIEDEAVVLDPQGKEVHHLNPPAAFTLALIQEHGFDAALDDLHQRYGPETEFGRALPTLIKEMKDKGILIDD